MTELSRIISSRVFLLCPPSIGIVLLDQNGPPLWLFRPPLPTDFEVAVVQGQTVVVAFSVSWLTAPLFR